MANATTYTELAANAIEAQNYQEAIDFSNQAIALDPRNSTAWLLKAKAVGSSGTLSNPRLTEVIVSVRNAINFAPSDREEEIRRVALNQILETSEIIFLASRNHLAEFANLEGTYNGYISNTKQCLDAMDLVLSVDEHNIVANKLIVDITGDILKGKA